MKKLTQISSSTKLWTFAAALFVVGLSRLNAEDVDTILFPAPAAAAVPVAAPAPAAAAVPVAAPAPAEVKQPVIKEGKQKQPAKVVRLVAPIWYPTIYPNPLAFNMAWVTVSDKTIAQVRALANRKVAVKRVPVRLKVQVKQPNVAAQNAIQQQMRKFLEPMLKVELSFAARVTDLNQVERRKLAADGKAWFEKFLVDYLKNQDPNQQQMMLQGMQGVWFGNQQQQPENPRDKIHLGVTKLVNDTLSREKKTAYANECLKRTEFARQVAIDNLVERIDEKVKLSPNQWKKITKSLGDHWDKSQDPQLDAFALNQSMWPGAPVQWVLPELSPAQQAVLNRVNTMSGRMFINGGIFGQMFGGDGGVISDMDDEATAEVAHPAAVPAENPEAE